MAVPAGEKHSHAVPRPGRGWLTTRVAGRGGPCPSPNCRLISRGRSSLSKVRSQSIGIFRESFSRLAIVNDDKFRIT